MAKANTKTKAKPAPKAKATPAPKAKATPAPKAKASPKKPKTAPKPSPKAKATPKKATAAPKPSPRAKAAKAKPEALHPKPEARGPRPAQAKPAPKPARTGTWPETVFAKPPAPGARPARARPPTPMPLAPADTLFADWQPYPKLRRAQLSAEQAAWLEQALAGGRGYDLQYNGLFYKPEHNRRFLAGPPGPSDVPVTIGGERVPLWNAVSDVASGHADPGAVLAAFRALPPGAALAAWEEIARGDAYDLHAAHALAFEEAGIPRTRNNVLHRTRFFGWMADASLALGDAGRRAADALAASTKTDRHGAPEAFIALLALTRHARAAGDILDAKYDPLVATLEGEGAEAFAAPVVQETYDAIPEDRAAWLPPIRQ